MKPYIIQLPDRVGSFYEDMADICGKTPERYMTDTLLCFYHDILDLYKEGKTKSQPPD